MSNKVEPDQIERVVEPPGPRLRKAREAAGLGQSDVAAELRLGVDTIDALERDAVERLPAPIFVRGYLRNYAALVGLPPEELVDAYNANTGGGPAHGPMAGPMQQQLVGARRRSYLVWLLVLAIAVAAGWWFQQRSTAPSVPAVSDQQAALDAARSDQAPASAAAPEESAEEPDTGGYVEDATPQPRALPPAAEPVTPPPDDLPPEGQSEPVAETASETMPTTTPEPVTEPDQRPGAAFSESDDPTAESGTPPQSAGDTLRLVFQDRSWVEVRDATGERLMYRLATAGETRTVQGQAPFRLVLGNAPAVQVELNGSPVDVAVHTQGRTARFSTAP